MGNQDLRIPSCHTNIWYTYFCSSFVAIRAILRTMLTCEFSAWGWFTTFSWSGNNLNRLRLNWLDPTSKTSISLLLQSTNAILNSIARSTNRFCSLSSSPKERSKRKPHYLAASERRVLSSFHALKLELTSKHTELKRKHAQLIRYARIQEGFYERQSTWQSLLGQSFLHLQICESDAELQDQDDF